MSKPKFDPSKPFQAAEGQKPKFNPNASFEVVEENNKTQKKEKSIGDYALQGIGYVGEAIDRLGPAQLRNSIAGTIGMKDNSVGSLIEDVTGSNAPSSSEIIKYATPSAGKNFELFSKPSNFKTIPDLTKQEEKQAYTVDTGISPADIIGFVADIATSGKANAGVLNRLKQSSSFVNPVLEKAGNALKNFTATAGETLTGIPKQNIKQYITNNEEINSIIKKNGGDLTQAADELREKLQNSLRSKILNLNNDIKKVVLNSDNVSAPKEKIIEALEKAKEAINPKLYPDSIGEIDSFISKVNSLADESGMIKGKDITDIKGFFQDSAKGTYLKGGQMFSSSSQAQSAAKQAAREARKLEIGAMPETAQPNLELSKLHNLEKNINPNLITAGKPDVALFAAGAGQNQRNLKNLQKLGEMTGIDAVGEAQKLSTAKQFAKPSWVPVDTTGKSFTRIAAGGIVGSAFLGPFGSVAGLAASSPAALKAAINSGQVSKNLILKIAGASGEITEGVLKAVIEKAKTPEGQTAIGALINQYQNLKQKPSENIKEKKQSETQKPSASFPLRLNKNGYVAFVQNEKDLKEALSEGWNV